MIAKKSDSNSVVNSAVKSSAPDNAANKPVAQVKLSKNDQLAQTLTALQNRLTTLTATPPQKFQIGELSNIFSNAIRGQLSKEIVVVLFQLLSASKSSPAKKANILNDAVGGLVKRSNYSKFQVFITGFSKSTPYETLLIAANFCVRYKDLESFKQVVMCMPNRSKLTAPLKYSRMISQFAVFCLIPSFLPGLRWLFEQSRFREEIVEFEPTEDIAKAVVTGCIADARGVGRYLCNVVFGYGEEVLEEFVRRHDMTEFLIDIDNPAYKNGPNGERFYDCCRNARLNLLTIYEREKQPLSNFPDIFDIYFRNQKTRSMLENFQTSQVSLADLENQYSS